MNDKRYKAKEQIEWLRREIERHNRDYYVNNSPSISDFEFDMMMNDLAALEKAYPEFASADSPTNRVGSDLSMAEGFKSYPHKYPMLSLGNTYNIAELESFCNRIASSAAENVSFSCELKFDGTAICLSYVNGRLERALTRGDGTNGDDVTANIKTISSIPTSISDDGFDFEIRGEIYMPFDSFERLNKEKIDSSEVPFANPRNAAAGSLKTLDPKQVRKRGLQCVLYHILGENLPFTSHTQAIMWAASKGFPVSEYSRVCKSTAEVVSYIEEWDVKRKSLPFATDGVVIKTDDLALQKRLGYTAKSPRWATAYKFKPEEALTRLLSIDYQIGRTGAITPVANLEPVRLSGTVVKRASLHNSDQMEALDIRIGDYVYVEKGGEIIPKITRVEISKREEGAVHPHFPEKCPSCGSLLVKDEDEARHYCNNELCPMRIKGRFLHFVSRKAMNINAGEATIEQLYDNGLIKTLPDLYSLTANQLICLEGWKEKSVNNFLESISESTKVPFFRVLYALGLRHIGETTAKMLASHFGSMESLSKATKDELLAIDEIGETIAASLSDYFMDSSHIEMIQRLEAAGVQMVAQEKERLSNLLEGKSIVISGNFSVSREEIKSIITAHSGKNTGSVSGKTSFLLVGEKPGPEKIRKAQSLGVKVISEEDFYSLINNN
ncbi:MAG: NAD-dependent DNA ligase LigA [Candidatus Coprenecus sp.]|nr:NAD-dependent DNA ligase LigA [Candidatus Coprenecus sp.]